MERFFNTAGPCKADIHYTLDPLLRLSSVRALVNDQKYFILHAPRQTGKTTTMLAFMEVLNREGKYIALYMNVESAQTARNRVEAANRTFLSVIDSMIRIYLPPEYRPTPACYEVSDWEDGLRTFLTRWCSELPKPLVLFIDEADALIGDSLLSLLRQLRSGYSQRPASFPHSVALIGLRDIRDYRIYSEGEKRYVIGGSAFNIKDESLTMGSFTPEEVRALYAMHTAETGQRFTDEALGLIFEQTCGQPWLVNALGRELCFNQHKVPDGRTVTADDVYKAGEILIQRRDTHIDHLADKLTEPRVARVVERILGGDTSFAVADETFNDDLQYVIDLGLVRRTSEGLSIGNPIYREVVPRQLTWAQQEMWAADPAWYIGPDGKLNMENVLARFIAFYKENGEMMTRRTLYPESAHHLAFMAWLQRIVNGGGYIRREYAAGLGFIDMVIEFSGDKFVFELKTDRNYKPAEALAQIARYIRRMNLKEGYLMVFRKKIADVEKIGERELIDHEGLRVHLIWV
jgi:AAA domain/PD-(D/E)XK nuclease superfamily